MTTRNTIHPSTTVIRIRRRNLGGVSGRKLAAPVAAAGHDIVLGKRLVVPHADGLPLATVAGIRVARRLTVLHGEAAADPPRRAAEVGAKGYASRLAEGGRAAVGVTTPDGLLERGSTFY